MKRARGLSSAALAVARAGEPACGQAAREAQAGGPRGGAPAAARRRPRPPPRNGRPAPATRPKRKSGSKSGNVRGVDGRRRRLRRAAATRRRRRPPATGERSVTSKTYTFGAMDVEGKLKTPQLLYFLNRVKLELDMSAPDKRSFMKELQQSADDKNL